MIGMIQEKTMSDVFQYFFEPRSVAVVGASKTPGKAGNEILVNLLANGYRGKVFPVNPGGEEILGFKSYGSVKEIPEPVDLAVFIVPAEKTLEPLRECAEKKIPAVVIASGGYAEVDEAGASLQEEILKVARSSGMRIIGPNTSGLTSTPANLTTTFFPLGKVRRGPISYIAQTGNFATHTMRWINTAERFGVARVAGLGNKIDIEDSEVLEYLGRDPETKAVLMYVEGFRDPRRFLEVARRVTRKKPVIVLKGGRTRAGAERAFSHTASLAGNEALFDGAFRQAGIARLRRYVDLVNVAKGIAFQPIPKGRRVSAMAPSGALGVVVADACESMGLKMASHSESTVKKLREVTASWVNISNPVDMSAVVSQLGQVEGNRTVAETLLQDEGGDALVAILLASPRIPAEAYGYLPELAKRYPRKPIYVSFTGDHQAYAQAREYLEERSIPVFYPLEDVFEMLHVLCYCREQFDREV
jgi:acyl-CoA synthetase (NDP forming)